MVPSFTGFERGGGAGEPVHVRPWCNGHVCHSETGGRSRSGTREHNTGPPKEGQSEYSIWDNKSDFRLLHRLVFILF